MLLTFSNFIIEHFDIPWIDSLLVGTSKYELYRYVNYVANQFGENLLNYNRLNSGSHGTVFELKSGKILKLTNDKSEAKMAQYLKDRDTKYLISCDSICKIVPDNIYALIMPKLNMHDDNLNFRIIWDYYILTYINEEPEVILDQDKKFIISEIENDIDIDYDYETIKKYIEDNWESIYGIVKEIKDLGINYPDIHPKNLGFNEDGNLIYLDVKEMIPNLDLSDIKLQELDISPFFEETIIH